MLFLVAWHVAGIASGCDCTGEHAEISPSRQQRTIYGRGQALS